LLTEGVADIEKLGSGDILIDCDVLLDPVIIYEYVCILVIELHCECVGLDESL
jgi:hypothetical protein